MSVSSFRRRTYTEEGVTLEPIGNAVSRLSWSPWLQEQGLEIAAEAVREQLRVALDELKQSRVEAWIDPTDRLAARIATWAGMQREGTMRGALELEGRRQDRDVYARVDTDQMMTGSDGFRSLLNSFLPRKRAIAQSLVRDHDGRVLMCHLTYKTDWDLPGGVVEVGESPRLAAAREVEEELSITVEAGELVLTDWLPPWGGWDDAVCLVFNGGVLDASVLDAAVLQDREIAGAAFCTPEEVRRHATDFTARRVEAALAALEGGPTYAESGRA